MKLSSLILLFVLTASSAHAQGASETHSSESKGYLGAVLGPVFVTSTGGGTYFGWGFRGGYDVAGIGPTSFSLGAMVETMGTSQTIASVKIDTKVWVFGAEPLFRHIGGSPIYAGFRIGAANQSADYSLSGLSTNFSGTSFSWAPVVGALFPVYEYFGIGLDVSYIMVASGTASGPLGSFKYDSASAIATMATLNYLF